MTDVSISYLNIFTSQFSNDYWSSLSHQDPNLLYLWDPKNFLHGSQEIAETWESLKKYSLLSVHSMDSRMWGFLKSQPKAVPY